MAVILQRVITSAQGTFGVLIVNGRPFCVTCEAPWNDNKIGVSCIPSGQYDCVRHTGQQWVNVWEVTNVPGHSAILIHSGNTIKDTKGCILVGDSFGVLNGMPGVANSVKTLNQLRTLLPDRFTIEVKNCL